MIRILVADNQPEWGAFSEQVLEKEGYDVSVASTVVDLKHLVEVDGYDLILVNADLMRGEFVEAIRQLFTRNADKAFIVVSMPSVRYREVQETRMAFKLGAKDCVDKPFSAEGLLRLVRQLVDEFVRRPARAQGVWS
jgi:DNA-binding response OmpR family regulator